MYRDWNRVNKQAKGFPPSSTKIYKQTIFLNKQETRQERNKNKIVFKNDHKSSCLFEALKSRLCHTWEFYSAEIQGHILGMPAMRVQLYRN